MQTLANGTKIHGSPTGDGGTALDDNFTLLDDLIGDVADETTARAAADTAEAAARAAADTSEASTRAATDSSEASTRAAADTSEASTRASADTSEASTRAAADTALTSSLSSHTADQAAHGATSANTASKIVARDASGNFAGNTFTGAVVGNATTATTATSFAGFTSLSSFAPLASPTFTGIATAPTFSGALAGNATTATTATTFAGATSWAGSNLTGAYTAAGLTLTNTGRILCSSSANSAAVEGVVGTGLSLSSGTLTNTVSASSGANPTASIGTTAVNGSASTFMRSDAAPAVDTTVIATLAGTQTYTGAKTLSNIASATFTGAVSGADTAGLVDKSSTQTGIAGAKTWTGQQTFNTSSSQPVLIQSTGAGQGKIYHDGTTWVFQNSVFNTNAFSFICTGNATISLRSDNGLSSDNSTISLKFNTSSLSWGTTSLLNPSNNTVELRGDSGASVAPTLLFTGKDSTTSGISVSSIVNSWNVSTHGSVKGRVVQNVYDAAARAAIQLDTDGTTAIASFPGWAQLTAGRKRVATSDFTNATTTFQNVTGLSITCLAGRTYTGFLLLNCTNTTATEGIKFDFNGGTATATDFWAMANQIAGNSTFVLGTANSTSLAGAINFTTITSGLVLIGFSFECNAAGTIILRMAENSTALGTAKVLRGSSWWMDDMAN